MFFFLLVTLIETIYFQNAAALKEISAVRGGHAIPPPP